MDWISIRSRARELFQKYRYAVLIVLVGVILMCLPKTGTNDPPEETVEEYNVYTEETLNESLAGILSQIKGAGKVAVLLTEAKGAETMYQSDTNSGSDNLRQDTVLITGADRAQAGLVRQVNPPSYLGAIVVCQGADSAAVRLAIVQAVSSVTGLGSDRITVLKMK